MILCARSTSRSREQSRKRRPRRERMPKVCLFYSPNNKILRLSNMTDTLFEKISRCAKVYGLFLYWLCFSGADWVGRQTPITWKLLTAVCLFHSLVCGHAQYNTCLRWRKCESWCYVESLNIVTLRYYYQQSNRWFPSCLSPLFQSES